jgi:hypothetical protein
MQLRVRNLTNVIFTRDDSWSSPEVLPCYYARPVHDTLSRHCIPNSSVDILGESLPAFKSLEISFREWARGTGRGAMGICGDYATGIEGKIGETGLHYSNNIGANAPNQYGKYYRG